MNAAARNAPTRSPRSSLHVVPCEEGADNHQARHDQRGQAVDDLVEASRSCAGSARAERVHGPVIPKNDDASVVRRRLDAEGQVGPFRQVSLPGRALVGEVRRDATSARPA